MKNWQEHLFPGICILCGLPTNRKQDLCLDCEINLPWKKFTNDQYSLLTRYNIILFDYQYPIDHLIVGLKFANKLIYAKILGELMINKLKKFYQQIEYPEVIIPMPLHKNRLQERGYNQALELAKPISKQLNIPINNNLCQRIKYTKAQTLIPAKQRRNNIKEAFAIKKYFPYKHAAIIDDVITTGNTMTELCKILETTTIKSIDIWCFAKTKLT